MEAADTAEAVYVFLDKDTAARDDLVWADVPTWSLIPGFVLGELKVAFLMGLRILLPFVIIDMLVGSVLVSMGMLMLPPVLIATPLKLLMFVLADGWSLIAGTLMNSFAW
jgi:flagellar biosynthetic protein FliP